ncbi:MAG: hypothetical protein NT166_05325 [Candidatus Aminicenantes bacterium]|nr:hypothetical protein [Candidatus Aminicenantes bacterium]
MEAIRQVVRIPGDHEVKIKVPDYLEEDDLVEIILLVKKRRQDFANKINLIRRAAADPMYLEDIKGIERDFENLDLEEWGEKG